MTNFYHRTVETLLANDPAFTRLKLAGRVMVSIILTIILLVGVHFLIHPLPPVAFALALTMAGQSVLLVRDPLPREQIRTRAIGVVACAVAVTIAAALDDNRIIADLMFLVIILFVCLGRAYGPRGMAAGFHAFMSYFLAAYLRPDLADVPLAIACIILAAVISQITRQFIIREDRLASLRGAVMSTHKRSEQFLETLANIIESANTRSQSGEMLSFQANRLKDAVLMSEGLIPPDNTSEKLDDLRVALFELQLAAESMAITSSRALPEIEPVQSAMQSDREGIDAYLETQGPMLTREHNETVQSLAWLARARRDLNNAMAGIDELQPGGGPAGAKPKNGFELSLKDETVRAAIQITLASALAMGGGLLLSRDRWFWAVLSAFLVFINTRSRGDANLRAYQRGLGTVLGIVVGLAIGALVSGFPLVTIALAAICLFLAFYSLPVSYTRMTFFISIVIALAYALMGMLTIDMMWLRTEETIIGALAGAFVASTIFPTRTTTSLSEALNAWYKKLEELLEAAREQKPGDELVDLSRQLDAAYRSLRDAARPLGAPWQLVTRPGQIRQSLAIFLAATYWGRMFARDYQQADAEAKQRSLEIIESIKNRIDTLRAKDPDYFVNPRRTDFSTSEDLQLSRRHISVSLVMLDVTLGRLLVTA